MNEQAPELFGSPVERLQQRIRRALDRGMPMTEVERQIALGGGDDRERWRLLVYARHYARGSRRTRGRRVRGHSRELR